MVLVVDIDEGNMMEPNNFKVAHRNVFSVIVDVRTLLETLVIILQ
jgi:hypothetical protein